MPINMHQAKTHFSKLVERAEAGEDIVIARYGRPVARLVPIGNAEAPRKFGTLKDSVDWSAIIDRPLPKSMLRKFGVRR